MQSPKNKKSGFRDFRDEETGFYFIQFLDEDGHVLLTSQSYKSKRSCDRGRETIMRSFSQEDHFERSTTDGRHFFTIKAGNHQEIARSRSFDSAEEMEKAVRLLKSTAGAIEDTPKVAVEEADQAPSKYSFRIDFYRNGPDLRGRIEYSLNREKAVFDGLDIEAVRGFISSYLSGEEVKSTPPRKRPPAPVVKKTEMEFHLFQDQKQLDSFTLTNQAPFEVQLELEKSRPDSSFEASVYAKSMERGGQVLIGKRTGALGDSPVIRITVPPGSIGPGFYRLITSVSITAEKNEEKTAELEGSRLVQIYE